MAAALRDLETRVTAEEIEQAFVDAYAEFAPSPLSKTRSLGKGAREERTGQRPQEGRQIPSQLR